VPRAVVVISLVVAIVGGCSSQSVGPSPSPAASRSLEATTSAPSGAGTLTQDQTIHVVSPFIAVATSAGVWVTSDKAVVHIDPTSGATTTIATPIAAGSASGLAASADDLWESDFDTGDVEEVSVAAARVIATVAVGQGPRGLFLDQSTPWVYREKATKEVSIDPVTARVRAAVAVPGPTGFAFGSWWSTSPDGGQLERLENGTGRVTATITVPSDAGACEFNPLPGLNPLGDALATFCLGDPAASRPKVAVIKVATNQVIATVDPKGQPFGGSIVVDGRWWLIEGPMGGPGRVVRVDPTSWSIDRTLVVGPQFDPDAAVVAGGELYVPIDPGQNLDEVLRFPLSALR